MITNPIKIKDIEMDGDQLKIELSNFPNDTWKQIYFKSLNSYTSSPVCYKNFIFNGNFAYYTFRFGVSSIDSLMSDFKKAIVSSNELYKNYLYNQEKTRMDNEIKQKQLEIERIEKNKLMNEQLKKYL